MTLVRRAPRADRFSRKVLTHFSRGSRRDRCALSGGLVQLLADGSLEHHGTREELLVSGNERIRRAGGSGRRVEDIAAGLRDQQGRRGLVDPRCREVVQRAEKRCDGERSRRRRISGNAALRRNRSAAWTASAAASVPASAIASCDWGSSVRMASLLARTRAWRR